MEQQGQILLPPLGTLYMIRRHGVAGERVGTSAQAGELLHHIALGHVEHLVLEIVGNPVGGLAGPSVQIEPGVDGPVVGGQKGVGLGKVRLGGHPQKQSAGQPLLKKGLPKIGKAAFVH